MKRILIQDFIAELKKINDDVCYITSCVDTFSPTLSKYINEHHAILIADKLLEETTACKLDIASFKRGFHRLLDGEKNKPKYYDGVVIGVWAR